MGIPLHQDSPIGMSLYSGLRPSACLLESMGSQDFRLRPSACLLESMGCQDPRLRPGACLLESMGSQDFRLTPSACLLYLGILFCGNTQGILMNPGAPGDFPVVFCWEYKGNAITIRRAKRAGGIFGGGW